MHLRVWYLRFLTADSHSWAFLSDHMLPDSLGLIPNVQEFLNEKKC